MVAETTQHTTAARPDSGDVTLEAVAWDHPAGVALRDAQQAELRARYGTDDEPGPPPTGDGLVVLLLLTVDGHPVGCGAVQDITGLYPEHGHGPVGEVKRLYVEPGSRGRGLSRRIMRELHARATVHGLHRLVLETGDAQPEAVGLYESLGYRRIPNYGAYAADPRSLCFTLDLTDRTTPA
ncbi:GNAT family N-acetyltransferase [Sanguibacter suaedae]|uniref:GNAT family N-acetyltransferase n=1 Tax=Sanguibacter suaedae TaxID=2795737 RepID=A0A934IF98_9MICO|nr:GNAT family N-acetyltransferase [Sanguibacter suaedae]MBI9115884.1 GNAT family N-acetyltransferase [Sanguibacter suaedae]